ncbi:MAG: septum formation initiator family protein [Myxococcaceae bacterium]
MRLQHVVAALMAVTFLILGYTTFSPSGLPEFWSLRQKKQNLESRVAALQERVFEQKQKIGLLSGSTPESRAYLEQIARTEYGFIGKEESLLIFH